MAMVKKLIAVAIATMMVFGLVACGEGEEEANTKYDKVTNDAEQKETEQALTKVTYVGLQVYDPVYIAMDKGFFKANGIDLELTSTVAGGATAVEMVSSGDVQGCLLSNMALCNAVNSGMPVIAVADIQSCLKDAPLEEFYVRADSDIQSVADLKGKNIAINLVKSSFHYTWLMALEQAGLSEEDVNFVTLSFAEQQEALENGTVDAIGLMQPYSGKARVDEDCRQLYTGLDVFGEKQFCEILLNKIWAEEHPEVAQAFVKSLAEASAWVAENQDEAKEIVASYTGMDKQYIDDYYFQPHCSVNMADAEYWLKYMQENWGVKESVKVEDVATNIYNPYVEE